MKSSPPFASELPPSASGATAIQNDSGRPLALLHSVDDIRKLHDSCGIPIFSDSTATRIAHIFEVWRPHNRYLDVLRGSGLHPGMENWQEGDPMEEKSLYDYRYIPPNVHRRRLCEAAAEVRKLARFCHKTCEATLQYRYRGNLELGDQKQISSKGSFSQQGKACGNGSASDSLKLYVGRQDPGGNLMKTPQGGTRNMRRKAGDDELNWPALLEAFCYLISLVEHTIAKMGGESRSCSSPSKLVSEKEDLTDEQKTEAWQLGQSLALEIVRRCVEARGESTFCTLPSLWHVTLCLFFYAVENPRSTEACRKECIPSVLLLPVRQIEDMDKVRAQRGKTCSQSGRLEPAMHVSRCSDVKWPCKFYLSQIGCSQEPPFMFLAEGPHALLTLHDCTKAAIADDVTVGKPNPNKDPEEIIKDDQWEALTSANDAHEFMTEDISRALQMAIREKQQCAVISLREACGAAEHGSTFLHTDARLESMRQLLKNSRDLVAYCEKNGNYSRDLTDVALLPTRFPETPDPLEFAMQCNFMRHGRAFLNDAEAVELLSERLIQEDIDLALLDREEVEEVLLANTFSSPSARDGHEESLSASNNHGSEDETDEAQSRRILLSLYEERIRAEWRQIERRWEISTVNDQLAATEGVPKKKTKNKQKRKKAVQQALSEKDVTARKRDVARQRLRAFVHDLDLKMYKNRHIAKVLNAMDKRGFLGSLKQNSYMRGSHLRQSLGDAVGTATLVRAHGRHDATTRRYILQKQLLTSVDRAEDLEAQSSRDLQL